MRERQKTTDLYTFLNLHSQTLGLTLHENEAGEILVHAGGDPGQTIYVSCLLRDAVPGYTYEVQKVPAWGWVVCLHPTPLNDLLEMRTSYPETPFREAWKKRQVPRELVPAAVDALDVKLALMIEGGREV